MSDRQVPVLTLLYQRCASESLTDRIVAKLEIPFNEYNLYMQWKHPEADIRSAVEALRKAVDGVFSSNSSEGKVS